MNNETKRFILLEYTKLKSDICGSFGEPIKIKNSLREIIDLSDKEIKNIFNVFIKNLTEVFKRYSEKSLTEDNICLQCLITKSKNKKCNECYFGKDNKECSKINSAYFRTKAKVEKESKYELSTLAEYIIEIKTYELFSIFPKYYKKLILKELDEVSRSILQSILDRR